MKKMVKLGMFSLLITIFFYGCGEDCNDCLELSTKDIKYLDAEGNNLLFGPTALYNPDDVAIRAGDGTMVAVFVREETETIEFALEGDSETYTIQLSEGVTDILSFELDERKSATCCGNTTFSIRTFLNSVEIDNEDSISIVR